MDIVTWLPPPGTIVTFPAVIIDVGPLTASAVASAIMRMRLRATHASGEPTDMSPGGEYDFLTLLTPSTFEQFTFLWWGYRFRSSLQPAEIASLEPFIASRDAPPPGLPAAGLPQADDADGNTEVTVPVLHSIPLQLEVHPSIPVGYAVTIMPLTRTHPLWLDLSALIDCCCRDSVVTSKPERDPLWTSLHELRGG